uniref:Uncharacterized protein n=1 Tax=Tetranychus urticae TaxID=32264 RepID=T1KBJ6_TETUR
MVRFSKMRESKVTLFGLIHFCFLHKLDTKVIIDLHKENDQKDERSLRARLNLALPMKVIHQFINMKMIWKMKYCQNYLYYADPEDRVLSGVMESWYRAEERKYNYDDPVAPKDNLDFVRIVSKTTQQYGCGQARDRGSGGVVFTATWK